MAKTKTTKPETQGPSTFTQGNKTYEVIMPQVFIPGLGKRTAMEICVDDEAQKYLLANNTEGSVIKSIN